MTPAPEAFFQTVERHLTAVSDVAMAVNDYASKVLDEDSAGLIELALVEALTNAIKHGSVHGRDTGQILVSAHVADAALVVEVNDIVPVVPDGLLEKTRGQYSSHDITDVASLPEGGRGLLIIILSMDEVNLRTSNDRYILSMVKYINT